MKPHSSPADRASAGIDASRPPVVDITVLQHRIHDEYIARRAYEIYESRGRADGHADDDWFRAVADADRLSHAKATDGAGTSANRVGRAPR